MSTLLTDSQIESIIETDEDLERAYFVFKIKHNSPTSLVDFYKAELYPTLLDDEPKLLALMLHTNDTYTDCADAIDNGSWLVLTEEEADERVYDYAESYVDDAVREIPEYLQQYFDAKAYIDDIVSDDRGSLLSSYDGEERYIRIDDNHVYYLYRN